MLDFQQHRRQPVLVSGQAVYDVALVKYALLALLLLVLNPQLVGGLPASPALLALWLLGLLLLGGLILLEGLVEQVFFDLDLFGLFFELFLERWIHKLRQQ